MSTFYDRVEQLARHEGLVMADFLRRCGIPYATFRSSRHREHDPSLQTIRRILRAFPKVRMEWLAWGTGEMLHPAGPSEEEENEEIRKLKEQVKRLTELLLEKERRIIELEPSCCWKRSGGSSSWKSDGRGKRPLRMAYFWIKTVA